MVISFCAIVGSGFIDQIAQVADGAAILGVANSLVIIVASVVLLNSHDSHDSHDAGS